MPGIGISLLFFFAKPTGDEYESTSESGTGGVDIISPHRCLESIQLDAENLYNLLDLMLMHSETIKGIQLERLLGLALNLSNDLQQWLMREYERRENEPD